MRKALGEPEALQVYEERMRIAKKLADQDPDNLKLQRDIAVSHERIGDVLKDQDHLTEALQAYEERMRIATKLADRDPDNTEWQRDLSVSYNKIGDVLVKDKDKDRIRISCPTPLKPTKRAGTSRRNSSTGTRTIPNGSETSPLATTRSAMY